MKLYSGSDVTSDSSATNVKCKSSGSTEEDAKSAAFCHRCAKFYPQNPIIPINLYLQVCINLVITSFRDPIFYSKLLDCHCHYHQPYLRSTKPSTPHSRPNNKVPDNDFTDIGCGKCPEESHNTTTCLSCSAWNTTTSTDNSNCNVWEPPIFTYNCYHGDESVLCDNGTAVRRGDIHCWG